MFETTTTTINETELQRMMDDDNRRLSEELRKNSRVVSLRKTRFNPYRKFTAGQSALVAARFEATSDMVSARKKRLNLNLPEVKKLNRLTDRAWNTWRAMTVPYPENGRRLVRVEDMNRLTRSISDIQQEIHEAEIALDMARDAVLDDAKARLGKLFNPGEYPPTFRNSWTVELEFPNVEPDAKLATLSPEIYEKEVRRIAKRFDEAVEKTEQEFTSQFSEMVAKLADRMKPKEDGSAKMFHHSTIGNLQEFFDRFRQLSLNSNPELDEMVNEAKQVIDGITPAGLRKDEKARATIADTMTAMTERLESMMTDRPTREISFDD